MYKAILVFSIQTYAAPLQKGYGIIVFSNENSGLSKSVSQFFWESWNNFKVYGIKWNYQNTESFCLETIVKNLHEITKNCKFTMSYISINHCINLICCFQDEYIKPFSIKCRLSLYFPIQRVDPRSLCPIVFPKFQIVWIYMELYQTIRTPWEVLVYS